MFWYKHKYLELRNKIMTLEDQILALSAKLDSVLTAVGAIVVPAPVVDFTPVLTAISAEDAEHKALSDKLDAVLAQFAPTPSPTV